MQWLTKFKSFMVQVQRVLRVTRKPTAFEFKTVVKITGLGIMAIGAIGFLLTMADQILFG